MPIACVGRSLSNLAQRERERFEYNWSLALRHFHSIGEPAVPLRVEFHGTGWRGTALEHWEGAANIKPQFERNIHQPVAPGVGNRILIGAILPDGSVFRGEGIPAPPKPDPAAAAPVAKLSAKKIAAAIAKAKKVIAKGADRAAVIEHLRTAFGIETTEI
jgi:hypothetical protein